MDSEREHVLYVSYFLVYLPISHTLNLTLYSAPDKSVVSAISFYQELIMSFCV